MFHFPLCLILTENCSLKDSHETLAHYPEPTRSRSNRQARTDCILQEGKITNYKGHPCPRKNSFYQTTIIITINLEA